MTTNYIFKHLISAVECGLQAAGAVLNHQVVKAKRFLFQAWYRSFADFKRSEEKHELKSDSNLKVTDKEKKLQLSDQNHESDGKKRTSEQQEELVSNNQNEDLENHQTYLQQNFHQRHVSHHQNDTGTTTVDIDKVHISESKYIINEQKEAALENTATGSAGQMPSISCDVRTQFYNERNVDVYYQTDRDNCLKNTDYILKDLRDSQEKDEFLENKYTVDISPFESEKIAVQCSEGQDISTIIQGEQKNTEAPINDQNKIEDTHKNLYGSREKVSGIPTEEQKNIQNSEQKDINQQKEATHEESTTGSASPMLSISCDDEHSHYSNEKYASGHFQTEGCCYREDTEYNLKHKRASQRQDESLGKEYTMDVSPFEPEKKTVQSSEQQDITTKIQGEWSSEQKVTVVPINDQNQIEDAHKSLYGSHEKVSGTPTEEQKNIQNSEQKDINQQKDTTHEESTTGSASPMLSISCDDEHSHYFNEKYASGHFQTEGFHYQEDTEYNLKHLKVSKIQDESLGKEYTMDLSLFESEKKTVQSNEQDIVMKIQGEGSSELNITVVPINDMKKREDLHNNFGGSHKEETGTPKEKKENIQHSEFKDVINQEKEAAHEDSTMGSATQMSSISYDYDCLHYNNEKYVCDNYQIEKYNYREALEDNLKDLKASQRQDESLDKNFTMDLSPLESEKTSAQNIEQLDITTLIQGVGSSEQKIAESVINDPNKIEDFHQRHDSSSQNVTGTPMEHQENIPNIEFKDIIHEQTEASHEDSTMRRASQMCSISSNDECIHYYNEKDATDYYQTEQFKYQEDTEYTLKDFRVSQRQNDSMDKKFTLGLSPLVQSLEEENLTTIIQGEGSSEQKDTEILIDDHNKIENFHKMLRDSHQKKTGTPTEDQGDIQYEFKDIIQQKEAAHEDSTMGSATQMSSISYDDDCLHNNNEKYVSDSYQTEKYIYREALEDNLEDLKASQRQDESLDKNTMVLSPLESERATDQGTEQDITTLIQEKVAAHEHSTMGSVCQMLLISYDDECIQYYIERNNNIYYQTERANFLEDTDYIVKDMRDSQIQDEPLENKYTVDMLSLESEKNAAGITDYYQEDTEYTLKDLKIIPKRDESMDKKFTLGLSLLESDKTIVESFEGEDLTSIIQGEGSSEQKNTEISVDDQNKIEDFHKMLGDCHQKKTGTPIEDQGDIQYNLKDIIIQQKDDAYEKSTMGSVCKMVLISYDDKCNEKDATDNYQTEQFNYQEDTEYTLKDLKVSLRRDESMDKKFTLLLSPLESNKTIIKSFEGEDITTVIQGEGRSEQKNTEILIDDQNKIEHFHKMLGDSHQKKIESLKEQGDIRNGEFKDIIQEKVVTHGESTMESVCQMFLISYGDECIQYYNERNINFYYQTERGNYLEDTDYTMKDLMDSQVQDKTLENKYTVDMPPLKSEKNAAQSYKGQDVITIIEDERISEQKIAEVPINDHNKIGDYHQRHDCCSDIETRTSIKHQENIPNIEFKDIIHEQNDATMTQNDTEISVDDQDKIEDFHKMLGDSLQKKTETPTADKGDIQYKFKDIIQQKDDPHENSTMESVCKMVLISYDDECNEKDATDNYHTEQFNYQEDTEYTLKDLNDSLRQDESMEKKFTLGFSPLESDKTIVDSFEGPDLTTIIQREESSEQKNTEISIDDQNKIEHFHKMLGDPHQKKIESLKDHGDIQNGFKDIIQEKVAAHGESTMGSVCQMFLISYGDECIQYYNERNINFYYQTEKDNYLEDTDYTMKDLMDSQVQDKPLENKYTVDMPPLESEKNAAQSYKGQDVITIIEDERISEQKIAEVPINDHNKIGDYHQRHDCCSDIETRTSIKHQENIPNIEFKDIIHEQNDATMTQNDTEISIDDQDKIEDFHKMLGDSLQKKTETPTADKGDIQYKFKDIIQQKDDPHENSTMESVCKMVLISYDDECNEKDATDNYHTEQFNYQEDTEYTLKDLNDSLRQDESMEKKFTLGFSPLESDKTIVDSFEGPDLTTIIQREESSEQKNTEISIDDQDKIEDFHKMLGDSLQKKTETPTADKGDIQYKFKDIIQQKDDPHENSTMESVCNMVLISYDDECNDKDATDNYHTEQFNYQEDTEYTLKDLNDSLRRDESMEKKFTLGLSPLESDKTIVKSFEGQNLTTIIQRKGSSEQKNEEISIDDQNKIEDFHKMLGDSQQKKTWSLKEDHRDIQNGDFKDIVQENVSAHGESTMGSVCQMFLISYDDECIQYYYERNINFYYQTERGNYLEDTDYIVNDLRDSQVQDEPLENKYTVDMPSLESEKNAAGITDYYQEDTEYTLKDLKVILKQDESMDKKFTLGLSLLESDKTIVESFDGEDLTSKLQGEESSEKKNIEISVDDQNKIEDLHKMLGDSHQKKTPTEEQGDIQYKFKDIIQQKDDPHENSTMESVGKMVLISYDDECNEKDATDNYHTEQFNYQEDTEYTLKDLNDSLRQDESMEKRFTLGLSPLQSNKIIVESFVGEDLTTIIQGEGSSEQKNIEISVDDQNKIEDLHKMLGDSHQKKTGFLKEDQGDIQNGEFKNIIQEKVSAHGESIIRSVCQMNLISYDDECIQHYNERNINFYYQTERDNYLEDTDYIMKDLRDSQVQDKPLENKYTVDMPPLESEKNTAQSYKGQEVITLIQDEGISEQKIAEVPINDHNKIWDYHQRYDSCSENETGISIEQQENISDIEFKDIIHKQNDATMTQNDTEISIDDQNKIEDFHKMVGDSHHKKTGTPTEEQGDIQYKFKDIIQQKDDAHENSTMESVSYDDECNEKDAIDNYHTEQFNYQEDTEYTLKDLNDSLRRDESMEKKFTLGLSPLESDKTIVKSFEGKNLTTIIQRKGSSEQEYPEISIHDQNKIEDFHKMLGDSHQKKTGSLKEDHGDIQNGELKDIIQEKVSLNGESTMGSVCQMFLISYDDECIQYYYERNINFYYQTERDNYSEDTDYIVKDLRDSQVQDEPLENKDIVDMPLLESEKNAAGITDYYQEDTEYTLKDLKVIPRRDESMEKRFTLGLSPLESDKTIVESFEGEDLTSKIQGEGSSEQKNTEISVDDQNKIEDLHKMLGDSHQKKTGTPIEDQGGIQYKFKDIIQQNDDAHEKSNMGSVCKMIFISYDDKCNEKDATDNYQTEQFNNQEDTEYTLKNSNVSLRRDESMEKRFTLGLSPLETDKTTVKSFEEEDLTTIIQGERSYEQENKEISVDDQNKIEDLHKMLGDSHQKKTGSLKEVHGDIQNDEFKNIIQENDAAHGENAIRSVCQMCFISYDDECIQYYNKRNINFYYQTERGNYLEDTDYIMKDLMDSLDKPLENKYTVDMPPLESENNTVQSYKGQEVITLIQDEGISEQNIAEVPINDHNNIWDYHQRYDSCSGNGTGISIEHQENISDIEFKDIIHEQNDATMTQNDTEISVDDQNKIEDLHKMIGDSHQKKTGTPTEEQGDIQYKFKDIIQQKDEADEKSTMGSVCKTVLISYDDECNEKDATDNYHTEQFNHQEDTEYTLKDLNDSLRQDESMEKKFTLGLSPLESDKTIVESFEGEDLATIIQGEEGSEQKIPIYDQNKTENFLQPYFSSHHNDQEIVHIIESKDINNNNKKEVANLTKLIENISKNTERGLKIEEKYFSDNIYKQSDPVLLKIPKKSHGKKKISRKGSSTIKTTLKNKNYKPSIKCRMLKQKYSLSNHEPFLEPDIFQAEVTQNDTVEMQITQKEMLMDETEKVDVITEKTDANNYQMLPVILSQKENQKMNQEEIRIAEAKQTICNLKEIISEKRHTLENNEIFSISQVMKFTMECSEKDTSCIGQVEMTQGDHVEMENKHKKCVSYTQNNSLSIPQLEISKGADEASVEKDIFASTLEHTCCQKYDISNKQKYISSNETNENQNNQKDIGIYSHHNVSSIFQNEENNVAIQNLEDDETDIHEINLMQLQKLKSGNIKKDEITQRNAIQMETNFTTEKADVMYQDTLAITPGQKEDLNKNQKEILVTEPTVIICEAEEIIPKQRDILEDGQMFGQEHLMNYHQEDKDNMVYIQKEAICDHKDVRYTMNDDANDFVSYIEKDDRSIPQLDSDKVVGKASIEKDHYAINLEHNLDFQKYNTSYKQKHKSSNKEDICYDQIQILNDDMIDVLRFNQISFDSYSHHDVGQNEAIVFQNEAIVCEIKDYNQNLENIEIDTHQKYCQINFKQLQKPKSEMCQKETVHMETTEEKIFLDEHENTNITTKKRDAIHEETPAILQDWNDDLNKDLEKIQITEPKEIIREEIISEQNDSLGDDQIFSITREFEFLMKHQRCNYKDDMFYSQKKPKCDLKEIHSEIKYTMNNDPENIVNYTHKEDMRIPQFESNKEAHVASVEKDLCVIKLEHNINFQKCVINYNPKHMNSNENDTIYNQNQIPNKDVIDVPRYSQNNMNAKQNVIEHYGLCGIGTMLQNVTIIDEEKEAICKTLEDIEIDTQQKYCQTDFTQLQKPKSYYFTTAEMTQKGAVPTMSTLNKITLDDHENINVTIEERDVSYEETLAISPGQHEDLNQEKVLITKPKEKIYVQEEIIPEKKDNLKDDKLLFTINQKCQFIMNYHQEDNNSHHKCNNEDNIIHIKKKARYDLKEVWSSKMRYTMNDGLRDIISYTQEDDKRIFQLESSTKAEASKEEDLYLNNLENKTYFQKNDVRYKSEDIDSHENDINDDKIEIPNNALIVVVRDRHINVTANKGTGYEKQDAISGNLQNIGIDAQQKCQINFKHLQKEKLYHIRSAEMIQQKAEQIETSCMTRTLHDYKKVDIATEKRDAHYAATLAITPVQKNYLVTDHEETLLTELNEIICEQEKIIPEHTDTSKDDQIFARCRQPEVEKDHPIPVMSYGEYPTAYKPVEKVIPQELMGHISNQHGEFQQKLANTHLPHATQLATGENVIITDPKTLITDNEESAKKRESRFEEINPVTIDKIHEWRTDQLKSLPEENKDSIHMFDQTTLFQRTDNGCNSQNDFQYMPKPSEDRKLRISKILYQNYILEKEQAIISPGKILTFDIQLYHSATRKTECRRRKMLLKIAPHFIKLLAKKLHPAKSAKNVLKRSTDSVSIIPKPESSVVACGPQSSISHFWIPEFSLSFTHREILMSDAWLDDRIIDAAQSLLRRQYNVDGLQSIVLSMVESTPISGAGVQIHYNDMEHWFTSSTMNSRVEVADSLLPTKLSTSVQNQLLKRYWNRRENGRLEVYLLPVDRQPNAYDCGLYAIANAIEFLEENGNPLAKYDNRHMRRHLMLCLENRVLEPFPKCSKKRRLSRITGRKIVI